MRRTKLCSLILAATLTTGVAQAAKPDVNLQKLFTTSWEEDLAHDPIQATALGDRRFDQLLTNVSLEATALRKTEAYSRLASLRKIPRDKLTPDNQLNYDLFELDTKQGLDSAPYMPEAYVFRPYDGPQLLGEQLGEVLPFANVADYDNFLARINAVGVYYDQWIAVLTKAAGEKRTQPRLIVQKVIEQIGTQVKSVDESPWFAPFKRIPASVDAANRTRLEAAGRTAVETVAIPALKRLETFFKDVYLPQSRDTVGLYDTPDGETFYRNRVKFHTTTDLNPQQIHEMGLAEVARIKAEMEKIKEQVGFTGSFGYFLNYLRSDSDYFYTKPEDLLAAYQDTVKRIEPQLPKLFGKLPKTSVGVRAIPAASAPTSTTAYYQPPSLDGSRPGYFYVNLFRPEVRPKYDVEVLTVHEAVPGHHLQIALSYEQTGVPAFRRNAGYSAYVEGWALYSEGLGYELGLYTDPYSKFGQLNYDMWRAVRLVVDTGIHINRWPRQYAIDYFKAHTAKPEQDIINEVDRYISWPGQALAYKVGERRIRALRAEAEKALGAKFDVRAFHDQLLGTGALPLSILEAQMRAWIAKQPK
jgi:uncharacterized protein (DUF885 family)